MTPISEFDKAVLEEAIENAVFGIAFVDENANLVYVNRAFLLMWAYEDRKDVIGKSAIRFLSSEEDASQVLKQVQLDGHWSGEMKVLDNEGETKYFNISAHSASDDEPSDKMMISFIDITKEKQTSSEVEHLNSILLAIRNVNQLIVQEPNFFDMLDKACESLVETRSYVGCSIALLDEKTDRIEPVTQAGEYQMPSDWSISSDGDGQGPECVIRAIRSHILQVFDCEDDCRECEYSEGKYKAVTIPIQKHTEVVGTIRVLIEKESQIGNQEKELLLEIAGDLAFARSKFIAEQARIRAEKELKKLVNELESRVESRTEALRVTNHELRERVKEMTCLRQVNDFLRDSDREMEDILADIIEPIQEGWQYPSDTEVRIEYGDAVFASAEFDEDLPVLRGEAYGNQGEHVVISVTYSEEKPQEDIGPFLSEEQSLLDEIVNQIADSISRRKAENALRESEKLLRSAIENAAIGMVMVSPEGPFIRVNNSFCEIVGYSREELLEMTFQDITHPEDYEIGTNIVREIMNGNRQKGVIEKRYINKDGQTIYARLTTTLIRAEDDSPLYFFTQVEDITERRELRKMYELIANSIPGGLIHIMDSDFTYLFNAGELLEPLGLSNEMLVGKTIYEILPEETAEIVSENYRKVLNGERVEYEGEYGEKTFLVRAIPVKNGTDEVNRILVLSTDITKQKNAEENLRQLNRELEERVKQRTRELRASERLYRTVLDTMPNAVTVTNPEMEIVMANQWAAKIHGFETVEEMVGLNALDLVAEEDHQRAVKNAKVAAEKGFIKNVEYKLVRSDGSKFPAEMNASVVRDEQRIPEYMIAVTTDITERKNLQEKLITNEKLAAIGKLSGSIAHDLRNPLGAIKNSVYFLNMAIEEPDDDIKESLDIIEMEISNAQHIIDDLLRFARQKPPEKHKLAIAETIHDVLNHMEIPDTVEIVEKFENDIPVVLADKVQLERVFYNLIGNAIDAMPGGGTIEIEIARGKEDNVLISIADNGKGISEENLERIFEPLFTTKSKGVGLGLAIVHSIVTAHDGNIDVKSEVDEGTVFTIQLPHS